LPFKSKSRRITGMDKGEYEDYLKGISNQVDILISDGLNLKQFREQAGMFVKMCNAYSNALEQQKKNAVKNPKLRNKSKRPAGPECFWEDRYSLGCDDPKLSNGYWRLPDKRLPRCPYFWALPEPFDDVVPPAKNRDESLPFHYALLTIIHDNVLPPPPYVIISDGIWNKCDAVPRQWWYEIETVEYYDLDRLKAKIYRALKEVKSDLPVQVDLAKREAAGTKLDITPAKEQKEKVETIGSVNIQNSNVILGDVQDKNLQIGDNASIDKQPVPEKSAETNKNRKTTIVAIIISFIVDLVFELLVYFVPITWVKNHPNSYGLQGSIIFLIPCLIVGLFKPQYRKWCWGVGAIAFIVLLLSLMGGPSDSNVN